MAILYNSFHDSLYNSSLISITPKLLLGKTQVMAKFMDVLPPRKFVWDPRGLNFPPPRPQIPASAQTIFLSIFAELTPASKVQGVLDKDYFDTT